MLCLTQQRTVELTENLWYSQKQNASTATSPGAHVHRKGYEMCCSRMARALSGVHARSPHGFSRHGSS